MTTAQSTSQRVLSAAFVTLVLAATGGLTKAQAPPVEYVDHEFKFAFQVPRDWKFDNLPTQVGVNEQVRVLARHPSKPMYVFATVGKLDKSVSKQQFESSPNRSSMVDGMIDLSLEQVYKKTSKDVGADRMIVSARQMLKANAGIEFYISTLHYRKTTPVVVAGIHVIPFNKPYMVSFFMIAPGSAPAATPDTQAITRVFNSFHILGEAPLK